MTHNISSKGGHFCRKRNKISTNYPLRLNKSHIRGEINYGTITYLNDSFKVAISSNGCLVTRTIYHIQFEQIRHNGNE